MHPVVSIMSPDEGQAGRMLYDRIGVGYDRLRKPDLRLASVIGDAFSKKDTLVNIGAGAGSYAPQGATVTAVDPSAVMLAQHPGPRRVRAVAEALPFPTSGFDAAMAVMTLHHWTDLNAGLAEMQRVSERQAVFVWDTTHADQLWLFNEYLPQLFAFEQAREPPVDMVAEKLDATAIIPFPIPHDFTDGYLPAFWRRPTA